jgi:hypothetical protein
MKGLGVILAVALTWLASARSAPAAPAAQVAGPLHGTCSHRSLMAGWAGHWEQALSYDAGKTWDTNWIMDFERIP